MIPYVSFNEAPGEPEAQPYWRAKVEKREATEARIPDSELFGMGGVIEVTVPAGEEKR